MSDSIYYFLFFWLGAIWGSFGNVVIYRLPLKKSVIHPGSACMSCHRKIKWHDNIPIIGWFILGGRCRNCKAKFSFRYSFVELLTGALFALAYYQFGLSWTLLEVLILVFGLVVISFIDLDHMIIPNKLSYPGIIIGLIGSILNPERVWWDGFVGLLMGGGFFWGVAAIYSLIRKKNGLGGGDIKLLAWIGAVAGWKSIPFVILSSSVLGSLIGIGLILSRKGGMQSTIPFGPYIALGALIYLLGEGQVLSEWYLSLHGF